VIPLYGFLEGDTLGLLVLAHEHDTAAELARKLQEAAALRVAPAGGARVWVYGEPLEASVTVAAAGLRALDRFDVRFDVRADARSDDRGGRGKRAPS
jgi:hypothetical protein